VPQAPTTGGKITASRARTWSAIRFEWDEGTVAYHLIGTTWAALMLVSQRFVVALDEAEITGWMSYPVEVTGSRGEPLPGYHGFAVTGRCGRIDDDLSPPVVLPPRSLKIAQGKAALGSSLNAIHGMHATSSAPPRFLGVRQPTSRRRAGTSRRYQPQSYARVGDRTHLECRRIPAALRQREQRHLRYRVPCDAVVSGAARSPSEAAQPDAFWDFSDKLGARILTARADRAIR
jgi:hypothetical protein